MIIPKEFAYKNITKSSRLRDAYLKYMNSDRALLMMEQIVMNDPKCKAYKLYANKFYTLNKSYICNMFIMKKDLFFDYCEFLFYVLFKIYEKIKDDFKSGILSINRERELAFVGEYITDIFIRFAKKQTKSYKELNISFLNHTEVITSKIKQTNKNTVNICYYCDLSSFEYLYISIQSILENSDKEKNYCVFILAKDIKKYNKTKILALQNHNFSIFFIDLNAVIYQIVSEFNIDAKKISNEANFKFFIPKIFDNFDRILCLDCNTLVLDDVSKLYNIQNLNKSIYACIDIYALCNTKKVYREEYIKVQSSVLLFDILKSLKNYKIKKYLHMLNDKEGYDVLSDLNANGEIEIIDCSWNMPWALDDVLVNKYMPRKIFEMYNKNKSSPKIINFNSFKPWNSPHLEKADIWWSYARKTPFYEAILYKNSPMPYKGGAVNIIQSHLSYKLGKEILSVKDNKLKILILPLSIPWIYILHFTSKAFNNLLASSNGLIKPEPMHHYSDNHEAIRIKNYLTYRLGNTLVKHPFTFLFRISKAYKEWRREKDR